MRTFIPFLVILCSSVFAQPYLKENGKTRHRFAQSVFGIDMQGNFGGHTTFITADGSANRHAMSSTFAPRFYISGVHFWGHAEFYFSFQFTSTGNNYNGLKSSFSRADIFGAKIYPWPVKRKSLRPFFGTSLSSVAFRQWSSEGMGGQANKIIFPLTGGINYCSGRYLFDFTFLYNPSSRLNYFVTRNIQEQIQTPPFQFSIGIRKWIETTLASEKNYLNGETERRYNYYKQKRKLSSWFMGAGLSSAFFLNQSAFNRDLYPYAEKPFSVIFPEISTGYFFESLKLHAGISFRHNSKRTQSYDVSQRYTRTSVSAESFIYLTDYHGFNPYLGIAGSAEQLNFSHNSPSENITQKTRMFAPGIIAGWDILPDKLQGFILRTNLRYFPLRIKESKSGKQLDFSQLEFNFIQLVIYPQRLKAFRKETRDQ